MMYDVEDRNKKNRTVAAVSWLRELGYICSLHEDKLESGASRIVGSELAPFSEVNQDPGDDLNR